MNEIITNRSPGILTGEPRTTYSRGGDIFMEGNSDMPPIKSQPSNPSPERMENTSMRSSKPVSQEMQDKVKNAWKLQNKREGRAISVDERRSQKYLIENGIFPPSPSGGASGPNEEVGEQGEENWNLEPTRVSPSGSGLKLSDWESRPSKSSISFNPASEPKSSSEKAFGNSQANEAQSKVRTGRAIWRAKNGESANIVVTGRLGKGSDGRDYVSIEGSKAGMPLDEIEFLEEEATASVGGAGGGRITPPPTSENYENPGDQGDSSGRGDYSVPESAGVNIGQFEFTDKKIINILRGVEDGERYATTDEERYKALQDGLNRIHDLGKESGQKTLALETIRQRIDSVSQRRAERARISREDAEEMNDKIGELREAIEGGTDDGEKLSDSKRLDKIEALIDSLDPNERLYPHVIAQAIEGIENRDNDHIIEDTLEYSLERFLNRADAQPLEDYPQFTFTESENIAIITHAARRFDEARKKANPDLVLGIEPGKRDMFKYLTSLNNRRRIMHELFRSMNDLESFTGLVTRALRKDGMSFIENQLVGVADVQSTYDQALLFLKSVKPQGRGWLLEEDFEIGDAMVREQLQKAMMGHRDHFFKQYVKKDGEKGNRPLRQWEIDRAFNMGRDLSGASERRVVYGILGDVPHNVDEFLKSVAHEPLARRLAPFKLIPERFFSHGIARRFLSIFKDEQKRDLKTGKINKNKYGYVVKEGKDKGKERGMYGSTQDDFAIMDLGITDPKSNSWRSRLLFLKNANYKNENTSVNGKSATIGEYLDATKDAKLGHHAHGKEREIRLEEWNRDISGVIHNQRLFLGVLMRYPGLNLENKQAIWENVARLMPSRIGSLLPNETLDLVTEHFDGINSREQAVQKWTEIAQKLWIAERMRVKNDATVLSGGGGELKALDVYLKDEKLGIDDNEKQFVKKLVEQGIKYAPDLSKVKFPFVAFLDDAPETDWQRLSDFDFTRILVNDHNDFQKGYGHLMGFFDNPGKKLGDAVKILIESFEEIKGPPGVEEAQIIFEPIVKATFKLRKMNNMAKLLGTGIMRLARKPTSQVEEFNLQAQIADDEHATVSGLKTLAQNDVLSDDPNEKDDKGRTQFERCRDELDVDKKHIFLAYARMIIMLMGPALGIEFVKAILPPDISKSLNLG